MTPRGSGNTPLHSFRCPDPLWEAAKARAAERDEPGGLSGALVRMLEGYVGQAALTPEQVALRAEMSEGCRAGRQVTQAECPPIRRKAEEGEA